jgi:hypothetical protein
VHKNPAKETVAFVIMLAACAVAIAQTSTDAASATSASGGSATPSAAQNVDNCAASATPLTAPQQDRSDSSLQITGLLRAPGFNDKGPVCIWDEKVGELVGLNDELWVQVEPRPAAEKPKEDSGAAAAAATAATPPGTTAANPATATASSGTSAATSAAGAPANSSCPNSGALKTTESEPPTPIDAVQYALFLNGNEVKSIDSPTIRIYVSGCKERRALVFKLRRNTDNKALWSDLLGSPTHFSKKVSVTLALRDKDGHTLAPSITGAHGAPTFGVLVISWPSLVIAVVVTLFVLYLVWGHVSTRTTLRDNLLPQLAPSRQPFSLGRCQMAFWFVLIFASFIFLYFLLWDYNTVSGQALALMGIASATALAAVAVDVVKDSPADAANRALQALGLFTFADIDRVKQEIGFRTPQVPPLQDDFSTKKAAAALAKTASDAAHRDKQLAEHAKATKDLADLAEKRLKQLQAEIQDRQNILRTYDDQTLQFASRGLFSDLTTDINGPTIHRLQVIFWTIALGVVFIVGVYRDLAMPPDFSGTLLALMGISSAGYISFKYPEKNN